MALVAAGQIILKILTASNFSFTARLLTGIPWPETDGAMQADTLISESECIEYCEVALVRLRFSRGVLANYASQMMKRPFPHAGHAVFS